MRSQIRAQAKTLLTGLSHTGARVFLNQATPLPADQLPALCIYGMDEDAGLDATSQGVARVLVLHVEALMAASSTQDEDDLDAICLTVEQVLGQNRTLGGLAHDVVPAGTRTGRNGEAEVTTLHAVMTFRVAYRTRIDDPTLPF
jgi:hypothetical protein